MSDAPTPASPPAQKNRAWIAYFAFVFVASIGAAGVMIWYNLRIQLKPEQLEAAQQLWKEKGPRNYNLVYTKRLNAEDRPTNFAVKVRKGKVEEVLMNGKPLEAEEGHDPRQHHTMERLFQDVERFMDIDKKPGAPKVYVTAIFDDRNGALLRYIRRVMGTNQRIEMHMVVEPTG